jgi:exodeoxyribonuclease V alpha subunit
MTPVAPTLDALREAGFFSPLEVHLARRLVAMAGEAESAPAGEVELRLLGAALAGRGPLHGQVCVSLREPPDLSALVDDAAAAAGRPRWRWPDPDAWAASLRRSALVGDGTRPSPLVLDDDQQLYLYRYWQYQERLVVAIRRRAGVLEQDLHPEALRRGLRRLFGDGDDTGTRGQRRAAAMAIWRRFSVIAGGPGTGKTTTVLKILALLQEQARAAGCFPLRLVLLAPTGKAAARLSAAIASGKAALASDAAIAASIPDEATTIHRALVLDRRRPTRFVRGADSPLAADVVVVDESSMVDLALMTKLLEAVPPDARLILLGDCDQLSSVEAGAILGDLCNAGVEGGGWSPGFAALIDEATGAPCPGAADATRPPAIADCIAHLTVSYRFGDDSGIGALSRAINRGDTDRALAYLALEDTAHPELERYEDLGWVVVRDEPGADPRPEAVLGRRLVEGFQPFLVELRDPAAALAVLDRFRVLCAHRRGAFGVAAINELVRRQLARAGLIEHRGTWYEGRPVMITHNDAQVGLFNGDVGLALRDPATGELRVHFADAMADGGTRSFAPARLPAHETAFALTVHKSQGSEFEEVLLLLPGQASPIVSRELVYTAVTRAKRKVTIVASKAVIREAVTRRIRRASGLRKALWGN